MKPIRLGPGSSLVASLGGEGRVIARWLNRAGHRVEVAESLEECDTLVDRSPPDLFVLDVAMPDPSTHDFLSRMRVRYPRLAMLVVTDSVAVEHTVASMQAGAYDYLVKPIDEIRLLTVAKNALAFHRLSTRVATLEREAKGEGFAGIIGRSPCMKRLYRQLERVAASDATVLVHGESGSGKELVAQAIHEHSSRREAPFVAVNCAAIPDTLQESELFGHEKGAFTGATERRIGRFEQANGGTLFFDEVGELTPALQSKLLRVLQERRFNRVGGTSELEVDVRVVAATHRDLEAEVARGSFRQDLFFRIAVIEVDVPPLREREGDIPLLAQTFLEGFDASRSDLEDHRSFDIPVLQRFLSYPWPGNVRELQNAVQRAAVLSDRPVLLLEDLPPAIRRFAGGSESAMSEPSDSAPASPATPPGDVVVESSRVWLDGEGTVRNQAETIEPAALPDTGAPYLPPGMTLSQIEELAVRTSMERAGGNISKVARELGVSRSVLYRKLDRYGLRQRD
jgi:DNA-binding NtrC family response regulator